MSKENLDNFFQQKANQRSFEFKDDYWKEMELLLEDEDDKKTPVPFWWQNGRLLLGSLMAIMAVGALYIMLKQSPEQSSFNNLETTTQNQNNSNSSTNNANSNHNNSNIINQNTSSINSNNTDNTITDNSTNTLNNSSNTNTNHQTVSQNTNRTNNRASSNRNNQNRSTVRSNQRNSNNRNNHPNGFSIKGNNPNDLGTTNLTANNKTDNKSNQASSNKSPEPTDLFSIGEGRGNSWISHRPDGTLYSDYEKTLSEETKFDFLDLIGFSEIDGILNVLKTKLRKPEQENKTNPPPPHSFIALGVHAGGSRYFYNTENQNEQPYSPIAGIYATFPLSKNLSLSTGLNYWTRGNINASLVSDSILYNFGFERISTTDFISRATYLEIPLSLKYRIRNKHIAEIGGNFSYLLRGQGSKTVTTYNDFGSSTQSYDVTNGYHNWLNNYDIAFRLGYHYQWNERGTLGLQWQYGFNDITPNNTFNHSIFDRNHQFRIKLGYDLIHIQKK